MIDDYCNCSNTFQRHTKCRANYCLRSRTVKTKEHPQGVRQEYCKFGFTEFKHENQTRLVFEDKELRDGTIKWFPKIITKRNDKLMIN